MPMSAAYRALYQRSIDDPDGFWGEQAQRIDWQTPYGAVLDDSRLPFARWFVGGGPRP
ncbi:acetyl-coenzyme A synthetase N-terminal domain-containing protein, partial [Ralstonia solanacearum]|uniref:acetyl-coenzyme A synthetase N-terminal domain-containing protein n=1 Tax=Ralstonia solanacearum TaxID=305 RepID=UPI0012D3ACEC